MANWKHIGRIASRVAGTVGGALLTVPTGGVINPATGYMIGAELSDATMKDNPTLAHQTTISPFNQMDAYTPNAKGAIKRDDYYWQEQGQDFNKVMGLVDTGVATASLLAPEGAIDKLGKNMSDKILSPNLGKQFTRNTNNITRDYLKKSSNLIDTGKQLMDVQSMLKTFAPNQFNDLHKKLKVKQDLSPYKIPSQLNTEQFHLPEWDLTPYKPTSILETNL